MTRKQAISTVLGYLGRQPGLPPELCKAMLILTEMQNGIPGKLWDDGTVRAAVERFIAENGRPPKVKELDAVGYLPPHPVVARQYGMTAGKWLEENYGAPRALRARYQGLAPQQLRAMFITEYNRLGPAGCRDFDRRRQKGMPSWRYTAKMLGVDKWDALRKLCGVMPEERRKGERGFLVDGHALGIGGPGKKEG